jgi:ribosomal-protein-alanine N-acetyltransferase
MPPGITDAMVALIHDEQERSAGRFIEGREVGAYLAQLAQRADIVSDFDGDRCRGFIAVYCNNQTTRKAFITLVLVNPLDRGAGVGRALLGRVLDLVKQRGFVSCGLEVAKDNAAALDLYRSSGFRDIEDRGGKLLMEITI